MRYFGGHQALERHEAEAVLPRALLALSVDIDDVEALLAAGHCYNVLERDDDALLLYERAVKLQPHPLTWFRYASMLRQCGRYEEAFPYVWNAHRALPDDRYVGHTYAEELIRRGKWLKAWPLAARCRYSKDDIRDALAGVSEWQGEGLEGKRLAVVFEGGKGDAFWLFRFVPKLVERGARVSLLAAEDIARFFEGHPYLADTEPEANGYDLWVSVFELLRWLDVEEPYWPGEYVRSDAAHLGGIGLCWQGGEAIDVRKYRSLGRGQADRLLADPRVVSIQYGENPAIKTWRDTADIIASLDLVVTVDTSVCHLAGAMGKPTWLVLGGYQDCKWGRGEATGWYPSMRIFRADEGQFGFDGVMTKVEAALATFG